MPTKHALFLLALVVPASSIGCSSPDDQAGLLGGTSEAVKESAPGPVADSTDAEVWAVTNAWADKTTANAKLAGVAWGASSGLSWEEKFSKWISSFHKVD